jgi:hypothetical protein
MEAAGVMLHCWCICGLLGCEGSDGHCVSRAGEQQRQS